MANVLSEYKKQQVVALGRLGWSLRRIERATGVRRETASTYLKAAGVGVRPPGGWRRRTASKPAAPVAVSNPAIEVTTDFGAEKSSSAASPDLHPQSSTPDPTSKMNPAKPATPVITDPGRPTRSPTASASEPYRELIELALARGRNAMAIWQDLVSEHGFTGGYQSVRRFVRRLRGSRTPEAHPVIVTEPGQEAQVGYGSGPMVRDPQSGKYRRTRLFVMTLGFSRKAVRLLVFRSNSRTWAELHEKAFRRLGGAVRVVVLDNLREGVLVPDIYDPTLNPLYRDVLAHYGAVAMPCRVRHPNRRLMFHTAPHSGRATAKAGCSAHRPPCPLRIVLSSGGSFKQRRSLS